MGFYDQARVDPETGHADYPHEPGTLYDCPPCEEQMEREQPGSIQ